MSKEQQAQEQPQVAIPLPKAKKNLVQIGCICMMLSVAMYGLVFATLTAPILEKVDAMGYVGLFLSLIHISRKEEPGMTLR